MFVLIKSHVGQALLPTKIDADYAVWPAECNVPNVRSFCLLADLADYGNHRYISNRYMSYTYTINHGQISSCINFFPNGKVLVS